MAHPNIGHLMAVAYGKAGVTGLDVLNEDGTFETIFEAKVGKPSWFSTSSTAAAQLLADHVAWVDSFAETSQRAPTAAEVKTWFLAWTPPA